MRAWISAFALCLMLPPLLAGCEPQDPTVKAEVKEMGNNSATSGAGGAALEAAAIEAGAIPNAPGTSPVGVFQRPHEAGSDSLCIVPDSGARHRFGLEVRLGDDQSCSGAGEAKAADNTLILSFDTSRCVIVADYDGEQLLFPGAVDKSCAALCTSRASLAGVEMPRTSSEEGAANAVRDAAGEPLCGKR